VSPINLQAEAFESKIGNISAGSTKSAFHLSGILGKALDRKSNLRAGAIEVSQLPQELKTIVARGDSDTDGCWMKSMPLWKTLVTTN
jgi:hypothetical protein